jgi:hypothetical protein
MAVLLFSLFILALVILIVLSMAAWIPSDEARLKLELRENWNFKKNIIKYMLAALSVTLSLLTLNYFFHKEISIEIYQLPLIFLGIFLVSPGLTQIYSALKTMLRYIWFK